MTSHNSGNNVDHIPAKLHRETIGKLDTICGKVGQLNLYTVAFANRDYCGDVIGI